MELITSMSAPNAVGPYSHAVTHAGLVYTSGQIGLNPESGVLVSDTVEAQARQLLRNLSAVLGEAGSSPSDIIKAQIYLVDMADFQVVNGIYETWLGMHRPARSTVAVASLPLEAKVEMDLIARRQGN